MRVAVVLFKELWRGISCADFCRFTTSVREGGTATPLLPHVNFGCEAPVPEFRTCLPSFRRPVCKSSNLGSFRPSTSRRPPLSVDHPCAVDLVLFYTFFHTLAMFYKHFGSFHSTFDIFPRENNKSSKLSKWCHLAVLYFSD